MNNKRGAELTIGTIVIIILALVVLVFLVYGFSVGWSNLFGQISNFGGGQSNVQTIVQACGIACTTESSFDYCSLAREVDFGNDDARNGLYTCYGLSGVDGIDLGCASLVSNCGGVPGQKVQESDDDDVEV